MSVMLNRRKWVDNLLSGKYVQGSSFLRKRRDGVITHCCLGVACEIVPGTTWDEAPSISGALNAAIAVNPNYPQLSAKQVTAQKLGHDGLEIYGLTEDNQVQLTRLNDYSKAGFEGIARYIASDFDEELLKELLGGED